MRGADKAFRHRVNSRVALIAIQVTNKKNNGGRSTRKPMTGCILVTEVPAGKYEKVDTSRYKQPSPKAIYNPRAVKYEGYSLRADIAEMFSENEFCESEFEYIPEGFRVNKLDTMPKPLNGFVNRENPFDF